MDGAVHSLWSTCYLRASGHAADPKISICIMCFCRCSAIFIENYVFIYGNWVGMTAEWSRIYLEIISVLKTASKVDVGPQHWISCFLKTLIFSYRQKLTFRVINLKIHLVEYVHMDHTDQCWFSVKCHLDMEICHQAYNDCGKSLFEITAKIN